jgi:hypothetical protein
MNGEALFPTCLCESQTIGQEDRCNTGGQVKVMIAFTSVHGE